MIGAGLKPAVKDNITAGLWLEPAVMSARQKTAGSNHKPVVIRSFTAGFSPAPIIFFIFKLITGSEGASLPVLTNPTVMMPAVTCKSGVVVYSVSVCFVGHQQPVDATS